MVQRPPDPHEQAAAGLDFDDGDSVREGASSLGAKMAEEGPEILLEEIENLLPEQVREPIRQFPITAMVVGVGIGIWLGMRKSDEVMAAASSLVSAAAMANLTQVMDKIKPA